MQQYIAEQEYLDVGLCNISLVAAWSISPCWLNKRVFWREEVCGSADKNSQDPYIHVNMVK